MVFNTQISDPVPGEHALHGNHEVLPERSDDTKKGFRICIDVLVNPDVAPGIQDADEHFFGMKVDSTIKLVLFGVKSHGFLLWLGYGFVANPHYHL
jgi:hypothetical protein